MGTRNGFWPNSVASHRTALSDADAALYFRAMQTLDLVRVAFALVAGYFIGGIPFGILVTRLIGGTDPRTVGSGRMRSSSAW